jgi:hypothetical protein
MHEMTALLILVAFVLSASIRHRESSHSMLYLGASHLAQLLAWFGSMMLAFASAIESVAEAVPKAFHDGWMAQRMQEQTIEDEIKLYLDTRRGIREER